MLRAVQYVSVRSDCYEQFLHNSTERLADSWQACQR